MRVVQKIFFLLISLNGFSQSKTLPSLDQFVGYYSVGVKPNKPFFRSRWYLKEDRLFIIYDSDIDRELEPYENGILKPTIFLSEEEVKVTDTDSTYYLVLNFEHDKLQSFRVIRPRKEWSTDLYGYRNDRLNELAIDTEQELTESSKTTHFEFAYSKSDSALVPNVALRLEESFKVLTKDFQLDDFPVTSIKIYPDIKTYHNAVLTPGAPKWQMGRAWDENEIRMLSTIVASEIREEEVDLYEMIMHEFIHCIHLSKLSNTQRAPGWLWEGIATYKGCCQWTDNPFQLDYMKNGNYPSLKQIEKDRTAQLKYDLGYYIITSIEEKYGWDAVLDLIKTNGDIKRSLNVSVKQFQKEFYAYLEEKYK
ncbi:MAG: hypothetical protein ABJG47_04915 [Ekhidna sp.]